MVSFDDRISVVIISRSNLYDIRLLILLLACLIDLDPMWGGPTIINNHNNNDPYYPRTRSRPGVQTIKHRNIGYKVIFAGRFLWPNLCHRSSKNESHKEKSTILVTYGRTPTLLHLCPTQQCRGLDHRS